ncbi:MAG TPA: SRPBCC family protein [Chitinophagaceae bacterium]|nr:SRPBCC family protein [Chitinophagaceae bacterium]
MKYLRLTGILLLVILALVTVLALIMPQRQRVKKTILLKAPASRVYEYLASLENFSKWSVWDRRDSTSKHVLTGQDGTVGVVSSWKGDPEISGEGNISITSLLPNKKIAYSIHFSTPKKGNAESEFFLEEMGAETKLTWEFDLATPRPGNIFNIFSNLDKKMGKDFEEGLMNLRTEIEKTNTGITAKQYDIRAMNFPATSFAQVRQLINMSEELDFFSKHLPILSTETEKANITGGIPHGLFYTWDEANRQTDLGAAIPVPSGTRLNNPIIQVVNIPASKAVFVDYFGNYDKIYEAHNSIQKYLAGNNLKQKSPVIESYIINPGKEADTTKWQTRIIYLVE